MDLKQFYFYIAIAEECNLTRAAARLYTTQPSLSRFISKLEQTLHVQLFIRKGNNSLIITEPGKQLLSCFRKVVAECESYTNYLSEFTQNTKQVFFGMPSDRAVQLMAAVLPEFAKLHPNIQIKLMQLTSDKLIEQLRNGTIDIVRCGYDEMDPTLGYSHLACQRIHLVVPRNHPLAARGSKTPSGASTHSVSLDEIKNESIVLPNRTTVLRKVVQDYFEENNIFPKIDIETATSSAALTIVETGLAIGFLPSTYISEKVCSLQLDPPLYYNTGLIYRKESSKTQWMKDLIRLCQEEHYEQTVGGF